MPAIRMDANVPRCCASRSGTGRRERDARGWEFSGCPLFHLLWNRVLRGIRLPLWSYLCMLRMAMELKRLAEIYLADRIAGCGAVDATASLPF